MGKRCLGINCPYLAEDGTCLLKVEELVSKCSARETVKHEEKDEWLGYINE